MMKRPKSLFSLFLALTMCLSLLPGTARAAVVASGHCGAEGDGTNLSWTLDDQGTLTISGMGKMADYSIGEAPWNAQRASVKTVVIDSGVTSIGDWAFFDCRKLTSVTIPNSVTSIGELAFRDCKSLTNITIPNSVTSIGISAFVGSSLTTVTIPNSVTSIGRHAFWDCASLTSIAVASENPNYSSQDGVLFNKAKTELIQYPDGKEGSYAIPNSVTSIGYDAFCYSKALTSVTIPSSVTSITGYIFSFCTALTSITVASGNPNYSSQDGVLFNKAKTELIRCPGGKTGSYTIPASVTSIGGYAFDHCTSLTSVTIPSSVMTIGYEAFRVCTSLKGVTILASVTTIVNYAFYGCTSLVSVTIPKSVTSIGLEAFYGCDSLTDVYYSGSEAQWNAIDIGSDNDPLLNAAIHYNSADEPDDPPAPVNPSITALYPANGAADVAYNSPDLKFQISYNKAIASLEGQQFVPDIDVTSDAAFAIYRADDDQLIYKPGVNSLLSTFALDYPNKTTITIKPTNVHTLFEPGTEYYITMGAGFVIFADGTTSPAISKGDWVFTTAGNPVISPKFSLSYDLAGGSGNTPSKALYNAGEVIAVTPNIPTRNGYEFREWEIVLNSVKTGAVLQAGETYTMPAANCLLTAKWEKVAEIDNNMLYVQAITRVSLANADAKTKESVQNAIYNLLFKAQYRPTTGPVVNGISGNFTGTLDVNKTWHPQNKDYYAYSVNDNVLGTVRIEGSAGCMSYASRATSYTYGTTGNIVKSGGTTAEAIRGFFHQYADPGEHVRYVRYNGGIHSIVFLGESSDGNGFYDISYNGGEYPGYGTDHGLCVEYRTYSGFSNLISELRIRDANGGSFSANTASTVSADRIVLKINCPVEAAILLNGVALDSRNAPSNTDFGSVLRVGEGIVFYLDYNANYALNIDGTGNGTMDVIVEYQDKDANIINAREFADIPIENNTQISAYTASFDPNASFTLYENADADNEKIWNASINQTVSAPDAFFSSQSNSAEVGSNGSVYNIVFNANGGNVLYSDSYTDADGILSSLPLPTRDNYDFIGWFTEAGGGMLVTVETVFAKDTTIYAHWSLSANYDPTPYIPYYPTAISAPTPAAYSVTLQGVENGELTLSEQSVRAGETVTITVSPDVGYELDTLTVTDLQGNLVSTEKNADGTYTFTQPDSPVHVNASFKAIVTTPAPITPLLTAAELLGRFPDLALDAWYLESVRYVVERGIMRGTDKGFEPNAATSRAMIAQMLFNLDGAEPSGRTAALSDVSADNWYADAVTWMVESEIAQGDGRSFGANDPITREQLAVMLYNYAKYKGYDVSISGDLGSFPDSGDVSAWAQQALAWAVAKGIIAGTVDENGNVILDAQGEATRVQVAAMFQRFCENAAK